MLFNSVSFSFIFRTQIKIFLILHGKHVRTCALFKHKILKDVNYICMYSKYKALVVLNVSLLILSRNIETMPLTTDRECCE